MASEDTLISLKEGESKVIHIRILGAHTFFACTYGSKKLFSQLKVLQTTFVN